MMVRDAIISRQIKQSPEISITKYKEDFLLSAILDAIRHNMHQDPFISDATVLVHSTCTNISLTECHHHICINIVKYHICGCILLAGLVLPVSTMISIILKGNMMC